MASIPSVSGDCLICQPMCRSSKNIEPVRIDFNTIPARLFGDKLRFLCSICMAEIVKELAEK